MKVEVALEDLNDGQIFAGRVRQLVMNFAHKISGKNFRSSPSMSNSER